MNRRSFLRGALAVLAEPVCRRAYSFIWTPPERVIYVDTETAPSAFLENPELREVLSVYGKVLGRDSSWMAGAAVYFYAMRNPSPLALRRTGT